VHVRHSSLLNKYSMLNLPRKIYNGIENFFRDHLRFGEEISNSAPFWQASYTVQVWIQLPAL